jgi:oligoribonuclease NrnB/cAMP/cGMP phosphodiesterase (DHH superfamily)
MTNNVLITHTDLDGIGCEVILRKYLESDSQEKLTVFREDYDTINKRVHDVLSNIVPDRLFITDISPRDPEIIEYLDLFAQSNKLVLLDHHETAADRFNGYSWARYWPDACGTTMTYEYLKKIWGKHDDDVSLDFFARIVRDYDLWIKKYPESDMMNQLFFFLGADAFVERCMKKTVFAFLSTSEKYLVKEYAKYIDRQVHERLEKVKVIEMDEHKVAVVFGNQFQSQMGEAARQAKIDADYFAMIDVSDRKVSLRTIKDGIHVGNIAKQKHLGGGNEKAAGFQLTPLEQTEIISQVFD